MLRIHTLTDPPPPVRRRSLAWRLFGLGFGLFTVFVGLVGFQNALLNFALPQLINQRPERLRIDYTAAWMFVPGEVHVYKLRVRNQSPGDQWLIAADHATGVIDLRALIDQQFHADHVRARGVSLRYRRRTDAFVARDAMLDSDEQFEIESDLELGESVEMVNQVTIRDEATLDPPIAGLSNPPDPNPDTLYGKPKKKWQIALDDVQMDEVEEIWIADYRLTGEASISAHIWLSEPYVDIEGKLSVADMRADMGDAPIAESIRGDIAVLIDSMNRVDLGAEKFQAFSATASVTADVQDLRFLDFYLAQVPWLTLAGVGHVSADVGLDRGRFREGSTFDATFPDLVVRFLTNEVTGTGRVHAEVDRGPDGEPRSVLNVDYDNFAIMPDGSTEPFVEGVGFHIDATSPDVRLDVPFTAVEVVVDLPESQIPNVAPYNAYLPQGVGLSLRGGTGTLRGHMVASSVDNRASGDLFLRGDDVRVQFDALSLTGDMALHARLADAELGTGRYDLSGSSAELFRVGLIDQANADERDGERLWSSSISVPWGVVRVGAPIYLDTSVRMTCTDSVPFVTVFADRKSLPGWVQELLSVENVRGEARLQLGANQFAVGPARISAGKYQVDLRYQREGDEKDGDLLARAGPLSVGIALRPTGREIQLFNAKRWFETKASSEAFTPR